MPDIKDESEYDLPKVGQMFKVKGKRLRFESVGYNSSRTKFWWNLIDDKGQFRPTDPAECSPIVAKISRGRGRPRKDLTEIKKRAGKEITDGVVLK